MEHETVSPKSPSCENCTVCSFSARMHSLKSSCEAGWARTAERSRSAASHTRTALSDGVQGFRERHPQAIEFFSNGRAKVHSWASNGRACCAALYVSAEPTVDSGVQGLKKVLRENPYTATLLCAVLLTFVVVWCIVPAIVIFSEIIFNIPPLVIFSGVFFLIWIPFYVWISSKNPTIVDDQQVQNDSLSQDSEENKPPEYETVAPPPYEEVAYEPSPQYPPQTQLEAVTLEVIYDNVPPPRREVHVRSLPELPVTLTV